MMDAPQSRTILLTGFQAFGGDALNPTEIIAGELHGKSISGYRVVGLVLPVVFGKAWLELRAHIQEYKPSAIVCLGMAQNRRAITPERVAINVVDARIPDNEGNQPVDSPVVSDGPVGYWSSLPVGIIARAITARGIPAAVSDTAGTFVCNELFYRLMHFLAVEGSSRPAGFIHVPPLPGQFPGGASLSKAELFEGIWTALACCADAIP